VLFRSPACFGPAFVGMRHCPACGAALDREETPDEGAELACPHCAGALRPIRLGEHRLRECDGCGGMWVDNRTFIAICRARVREAELAHGSLCSRHGAPHPVPQQLSVLPVTYLRCPVCRTVMSRVNFAHVSGVVVDVCQEHGTWFGRGELQGVVDFLGRGGLPSFAPFIPEGGR